MSSIFNEILEKTLADLNDSKLFPEPVHEKLSTLFTNGRITKKRVISVLESDMGETDEAS